MACARAYATLARMSATPRVAAELPPVLTMEDVAAALRISVAHARRLAAAGAIPARRRGRRWYVLRDELERALRPLGDDEQRGGSKTGAAAISAQRAKEGSDGPTA